MGPKRKLLDLKWIIISAFDRTKRELAEYREGDEIIQKFCRNWKKFQTQHKRREREIGSEYLQVGFRVDGDDGELFLGVDSQSSGISTVSERSLHFANELEVTIRSY
jgi:hypothetical protein